MYYLRFVLLLSSIVVSACQGSGSPQSDAPNEVSEPELPLSEHDALLTRQLLLEEGDAACAHGGVLIETGIDQNLNGLFEDEELESSNSICANSEGILNGEGSIESITSLQEFVIFQADVQSKETVPVHLEIEASEFTEDLPLFIRVSDTKGYVQNSIFSRFYFSDITKLPITSRISAEAFSDSTELFFEFCYDLICSFKVFDDITIDAYFEINPTLNSATLMEETINYEGLVGRENLVPVQLDIDAQGFNFHSPLFLYASGSSISYSQSFKLNNTDNEPVIFLETKPFSDPGSYFGTIRIDLCAEAYCSSEEAISTYLTIYSSLRFPVVNISAVEMNIETSQVVLEEGELTYQIELSSNDSVDGEEFYIQVFDPTGTYFESQEVSKTFGDEPISIDLNLTSLLATESEIHNFQIFSNVCLNYTCEDILNETTAVSNVLLNLLYPSANLIINESELSIEGKLNSSIAALVSGEWSWDNLGNLPVFLVASDSADSGVISSAYKVARNNEFSSPIDILPFEEEGIFNLFVDFQLCIDPVCELPISNEVTDIPVEVEVLNRPGWVSYQGGAQHNGYVSTILDVSNFVEIWTTSVPGLVADTYPIAIENGHVAVTSNLFHDTKLTVLDESSGTEIWTKIFKFTEKINPPAIHDSEIWLTIENNEIYSINLNTGETRTHTEFIGQCCRLYYAPTPFGSSVFLNNRGHINTVYSISALDNVINWVGDGAYAYAYSTPAIYGNYVVTTNGLSLQVSNRLSGILDISIPHGLEVATHHSEYDGAPAISGKYAVAYAGHSTGSTDRYLSVYDLESMTHLWNSDERYLSQPAINDGVVYVGGKANGRVDALTLESGELLWSWMPEGEYEDKIMHNMIVTDNLLFVSTNQQVYAIDLETRDSVWAYPEPGEIALSDNDILFILKDIDDEIIAIDLSFEVAE